MPARAFPTPLMLTNMSRLADSSTSLSMVSAMAWSTASSWEVKCWIAVFASDSAKSSINGGHGATCKKISREANLKDRSVKAQRQYWNSFSGGRYSNGIKTYHPR
jgi:hypothetical protein